MAPGLKNAGSQGAMAAPKDDALTPTTHGGDAANGTPSTVEFNPTKPISSNMTALFADRNSTELMKDMKRFYGNGLDKSATPGVEKQRSEKIEKSRFGMGNFLELPPDALSSKQVSTASGLTDYDMEDVVHSPVSCRSVEKNFLRPKGVKNQFFLNNFS